MTERYSIDVDEARRAGYDLVGLVTPCDLCDKTGSFNIPGDPSGKIRICANCGFVFVPERRSVAAIALAWEQIYNSGGYDPSWPGVKARLFYVAEWIDANIGLSGRSVLDIGAGNGSFLEHCRRFGAHPVGLDPSEQNCRAIRSKDIACFQGWADDKAVNIGQYDFVTLTWTLENTGDCLAVLRYAERCLAKDGKLVIATGSRILVPFKKPLSSYLPQRPDYAHDTHCFRWSVNSLTRACEAVGFVNHKMNDYEQRDELVMSFERGEGANEHDDPQSVFDFFKRWKEQFP